jgi:hypothetical protein
MFRVRDPKGEQVRKLELEIFIPGELKDEPVLCDLIRNFDISLKIVEASFSAEKGWAYLLIDGDDAEVDKMLDFLGSKNIQTDIRSRT